MATPWVRARVSVGHCMLFLTAGPAVGLAVVTLASSPLVAAAGLFIAGATETMTGIVQVSYRLAIIPDALQEGVNSSYRLMSFSAVIVGTGAGGFLLEAHGPRSVLLLLAGGIALIAAGVALSQTRRL